MSAAVSPASAKAYGVERVCAVWVFLTKTAKSQFCRAESGSCPDQFGCLGPALSHSSAANRLTI